MTEPTHVAEVFLTPGELHFAEAATRIRTLLGSCVSLVFWHPLRAIGGMCHYMLPFRPPPRAADRDGRYGDDAVEAILNSIAAAHANAHEFRVQLFGGGNMFPAIVQDPRYHIGKLNVEAARKMLAAHRIAIHGEHVEGVGCRQIAFDTWSGLVRLRMLAPGRIGTVGKSWNLPTCPI